ncbi:glucuronate isomerase [Planctomycetota bacterium]
MREFLDEDFLLQSEAARSLYHSYAVPMPIYDYHNHLPVQAIADDFCFENLTQAWLYGDHYKWRAMRTNGVAEPLVTGDGSDRDKFQAWAETVPYCLGNPLYHWTHLELKRYFDISGMVLNGQTADRIYQIANERLTTKDYSVRNLLRKQNVKLVCTTEDPLDSLDVHAQIQKEGGDIAVHTAWRPDKAMELSDTVAWNTWVDRLAALTDSDIKDYATFFEALWQRHEYFHDHGCRLSDHGMDRPYAMDRPASPDLDNLKQYMVNAKQKTQDIFHKARSGQVVNSNDQAWFKAVMMVEFAGMDSHRGWAQQLHIGALRNNSTRLFHKLGPDTGFDSIGDLEIAEPLSRFLDSMDVSNRLPKTILYNLNPRDNAVLATMTGNFQDGSVPGKMQFGAGWWFLDQKYGMEEHLKTLSSLGLLSRFVGMLTDSRSFLSFPRHEYFRRILCNFLGQQIEDGDLPCDMDLVGGMVQDICYNNAKAYFPMTA